MELLKAFLSVEVRIYWIAMSVVLLMLSFCVVACIYTLFFGGERTDQAQVQHVMAQLQHRIKERQYEQKHRSIGEPLRHEGIALER